MPVVVVEVAAGPLVWVEAGRGDEVGMAVRAEADLPAGVWVVDESVVPAAEQHEVVQVGGPAVDPRFDVVGLGPAWGPVTLGKRAAAVADVQGTAQRPGS